MGREYEAHLVYGVEIPLEIDIKCDNPPSRQGWEAMVHYVKWKSATQPNFSFELVDGGEYNNKWMIVSKTLHFMAEAADKYKYLGGDHHLDVLPTQYDRFKRLSEKFGVRLSPKWFLYSKVW